MKFIICVIILLSLQTAKGQKDERYWRQELIGSIIDDPPTLDLKLQIDDYISKRDSIRNSSEIPLRQCRDNCLHIESRKVDIITIDSEPIRLNEVRGRIFEFLKNSNTREFPETQNEESSLSRHSKRMVYVEYDSVLTDYTKKVIRETAKGISDYKSALSQNIYGKTQKKLSSEEKAELDSKVNWRLFLSNSITEPPAPTPPPVIIIESIEEEETEKGINETADPDNRFE